MGHAAHLALVRQVSGENDTGVVGANSNVSVLPTLVEHESAGSPTTQLLVIGRACCECYQGATEELETVARLSIGRWRSASRSQSGRTKSRHNDHTDRARRQFDHRSIGVQELQPVRVCSAWSWIAQAARRWMTKWGVQRLMLQKTQVLQKEASSS